MQIEYVGLQSPHRERLYGTKTLFSGPGDVKDVDKEIARKMIANHPDQYAHAGGAPVHGGSLGDAKTESGATAPSGTEILVGDEYVRVDDATKDQLAQFALANFNVELVKSRKIDKLQAEVLELMSAGA